MYQYQSQSQESSSEQAQASTNGQASNSERQSQLAGASLFPANTLLQKGSRGNLVQVMQQALLKIGMSIVVDGVFGLQTEKIVRLFQRIQKMDIDGVAGDETLRRLSSLAGGGGMNANGAGNQGTSNASQSTSAPETASVAPEPATPQMVEHRVFPGESLWGIAQQYYGNGARWREIAQANGLSDASVLRVGQVLQIPGAQNASAPVTATPAPSTGSSSPQAPAPETGGGSAAEAPSTQSTQSAQHQVFPGESLWGIAQQYYGNGSRWREIAQANGLSDASVLRVGQILQIPNVQSSSPSPAPTTSQSSGASQSTSQTASQPTTVQAPPVGSAGMGASDPISLAGLSGLRRSMAGIYNDKGAYLKQKADQLGISVAAAAAVLHVESGGRGYSDNGNMIIRFENHIFWDQWGSANPGVFAEHFQQASNKRWTGHKFRKSVNEPFESFHNNQTKEWEVLEFARGLSDTAALKSISMGAAQIMGFNHRGIGYGTVQEMFEAMCNGLPAQLDGMFAFIQNNSRCMRGLRGNDYVLFASAYNGSGQAETYGGLISAAASAYSAVTAGRSQG